MRGEEGEGSRGEWVVKREGEGMEEGSEGKRTVGEREEEMNR